MSENHAVATTLKELPQWREIAGRPAIQRKFRFKDFPTAWAFLNQVAILAALRDQYPEITNNCERITIVLRVHDTEAAEGANIQMAKAIDAIIPPPPVPTRKVKVKPPAARRYL